MMCAVMSFPNATGQSSMYGDKPNGMLVFSVAEKTGSIHLHTAYSELWVLFISIFLHVCIC